MPRRRSTYGGGERRLALLDARKGGAARLGVGQRAERRLIRGENPRDQIRRLACRATALVPGVRSACSQIRELRTFRSPSSIVTRSRVSRFRLSDGS